MDPVLQAVLASWNWRPSVILTLLLMGVLYGRGWWLLRQRSDRRSHRAGQPWPLSAGWRIVAYFSGLVVIGLALLSPIEMLSGQLFFMHMIQHLLLVMIAPPLLLIANPFGTILWGLPAGARRRVGGGLSHILHRDSPSRRLLRVITAPGVVWLAWVIVLVGWHDANMYNLTLRNEVAHDIEHLSFFLVSMLSWWRTTAAAPRVQGQTTMIARIILILALIPPNMFTGVVIAFAENPIYTYYLDVPRLWNISVMTDQRIGGVLMWIPGSMMYLIAGLILVAQLLGQEERKPPLTEKSWATDEALLAPGLKKVG
jgi:putative membrane protein